MNISSSSSPRSIQQKLRRLVLTASLISILLTCLGFMLYEISTYPGRYIASLKASGEIIGANSTAALAFDNRQDATEVLKALEAQPRILAAAIYDTGGNLFVRYERANVAGKIPSNPPSDGAQYSGGRIELSMPIHLRETRMGTLFIAADLEGIYSRFRSYGLIILVVIIGSFSIAVAIASRMQRRIAAPILELSEAAQRVTDLRDYAVRVPGDSGDEVGALGNAFNIMLAQIADHEATLRAANDSLHTEIRERERAERIISASEKRFRHLFANHPLPMWVFDLENLHFLEVNESAIQKYGFSRQEFLKMKITDIRPSLAGPRLFQTSLHPAGAEEFAGIWKHLLKDGTVIDVEIITHATEMDGRRASLVVSIDVTERLKAEQQLTQSEQRYRALVSAMTSVVWNADSRGMFTAPQISWEQYTGQPVEYYSGSGWLDAFHPEDRKSVTQQWIQALEARTFFLAEGRISHADSNSYRYCEMRAMPMIAANGQFGEWIGTLTDIHDKKLAQEEIRLLNAGLERRVKERTVQLELANKELEAFSYSVSHDLRAPLRGINGFSQLLLEDYGEKLDEQGKSYIDRVRTSTMKMSTLIDDLLNLARVSRAELSRGPINLSELVRSISFDLHHADPLRSVTFEIAQAVMIDGDERLIRVVMENLLNNAWKYTSKRAHATIEFGTRTETGRTVYFIRDNGSGFDMNFVSQLFRPFQRLHTGSDFAGNGIGLATVQRIIQRHGGSIWAEGKINEGATFSFTI